MEFGQDHHQGTFQVGGLETCVGRAYTNKDP